MRFNINKEDLAQITNVVQRAASSKDAMPVLAGMHISSSEEEIYFSATDLEIGIRKKISSAEIISPGKALVNARYFTDLVKYLPDTSIAINLEEERSKLHISYGRSSSDLNIFDDTDYPKLPLDKIINICEFPQALLREAIKKTSFAAALNHFKPVFTGILFDFDENGCRVVASDTHRLAIISNAEIISQGKPAQFVVPARALNELSRILEESDQPITVGIAENNVFFYNQQEGFYFLSRLIEGQYPNYRQVIPGEFQNTYRIEAAHLEESLERAALLPTDNREIRNVNLEFNGNELVISAYSEKMGEMNEVIESLETDKETGLKISFNTRYLLDIVKILRAETDKIEMKLTGAMSPALIDNPEKPEYAYVLVPLRTG